jgi:hypothetical protein
LAEGLPAVPRFDDFPWAVSLQQAPSGRFPELSLLAPLFIIKLVSWRIGS